MNLFKSSQKYLLIYIVILTIIILVNSNFKTSNQATSKTFIIENQRLDDYSEIFKEGLSKSNHLIIKSGKYPLANPIYLNSNTIIEGENGTVLIKKSIYSHVFVNRATLQDYPTYFDSAIVIKNLTIDAQLNGTQKDAANKTANGHLSFKFLKNLTLDNIKIKNGDPILYGLHLQSVKNSIIKEYTYVGQKDGIHINGGCSDLIIEEFDITSLDDAFGIMTDDYPRVQHNTQDIKNIIIRNGISKKDHEQKGFFIRFVTGSWQEWRKGNLYKIGHTINYKGLQYKKTNEGDNISEILPIHTFGDSTYKDNITWRFIGKGTNTSSTIKNIIVENVILDDDRKIIRVFDDDEYNNSLYPGTKGSQLTDINIKNIFLSNGNKILKFYMN